MLEKLDKKYQQMQKEYGDSNLDAITFGGCKNNPDICFVFMNPTGKNVASVKEWKGIKSPWIGTKNIWKMFFELDIISKDIYNQLRLKKPNEWTEDFAVTLYKEIENKKIYITNLAKCTQTDARSLKDYVFKEYLDLFFKELDIVKPNKVVLFGNQVSSIVLDRKISVSTVRKQEFEYKGFSFYSVYYPVGNGIFNIDKAIADIKYIMSR